MPHISMHSIRISIHAPAKGATSATWHASAGAMKFQSTLPRRERLCNGSNHVGRSSHFNPRSREGSDAVLEYVYQRQFSISIHAPAKGATMLSDLRAWAGGFQSTLPRRERRNCNRIVTESEYFNPRSREGSDIIIYCLWGYVNIFQSTLPRRERPRHPAGRAS